MAVRPDATSRSAAPLPKKGEEDLEQYGVWVKAEPQDIAEEPETIRLDAVDAGPDPDAIVPEEGFLSEDEERLLGSFEELDAEPVSEGLGAPAMGDDMGNLPPLEDFEVKEEAASDVEDLGASIIDISLEDLETHHESIHSFRPDAEIDMSAIKGLDSEDSPAPKASPSPSIIEDVSAEFLDLEDTSASSLPEAADVTAEFLDSSDGPGPDSIQAVQPEPEFETIDMDLHFDDTIAHSSKASSLQEPGFEEVSDFDDFLSSEHPDITSAPPAAFDDLAAVEEDLAASSEEDTAPEPSPAPRAQAVEPQLANDLLRKIAEELSSIRGELVTLKSQIVALKEEGVSASPAAAEPEASPESEDFVPKAVGGFFDEEEDETIALTGDELDNILSSANFTEESISGEEAPLGTEESSLTDELILPENGDYQAIAGAPAIEEIRLEPAEIMPEAEEEEESASPIDILTAEEILPMTPAPEDTSYLEEPLPEEEALDLNEIPLHEESLLEAEPLSLDIEETEPFSIDSEELPVVQEGSAVTEEELPDMTLGMEADAAYVTESVPEAEALPPIEEFEEVNFGEISLGEESLEAPSEAFGDLVGEEEVSEASPLPSFDETTLDEDIEAKTVKPAQPVSFHPDEIPMSLDDSFFVGVPPVKEEEVEENLVEEKLEEIDFSEASPGVEETVVEEDFSVPDIEEGFEPSVEEFAEPQARPAPVAPEEAAAEPRAKQPAAGQGEDRLKTEIKVVLSYLDKLLDSLPEDKIEEFAHSEFFVTYKKLFEELGLV